MFLLSSHEVVFLKPPFVIPHSGHRVKKRDRKDGSGTGLEERRQTELLLLWEEDLVVQVQKGSRGQSQEKHRNVQGGPVARLSRQATQDGKVQRWA